LYIDTKPNPAPNMNINIYPGLRFDRKMAIANLNKKLILIVELIYEILEYRTLSLVTLLSILENNLGSLTI
jgi:hypothetical protein